MSAKNKPNNKNVRALFSVICLCIIALGLIVYFSTESSSNEQVNENTTVGETETEVQTTEVQNRVTVEETTAEETTKEAAEAETETTQTEPATMEQNETNTPYKSYYKYPCGETVLSGYSEELVKNETMGDYRAHTAIDFKAEAGSEVVAINDGLVLSVEKDNLLGTVIEIDHGGTLTARYCGLDVVNVSEGDYVTIGQTLGTLGSVAFESQSESHLHFETKLDGEYVNPLDVMGKTE